jgi:hypothetical protein
MRTIKQGGEFTEEGSHVNPQADPKAFIIIDALTASTNGAIQRLAQLSALFQAVCMSDGREGRPFVPQFEDDKQLDRFVESPE